MFTFFVSYVLILAFTFTDVNRAKKKKIQSNSHFLHYQEEKE